MKKIFEFLVVIAIIAMLAALVLTGCKSMSETAQKLSDDLGDKAQQGFAFIDIWKVTPSDPATNSSPTIKKITIIGDVKSIPMTSKTGETVKDYAEYRKTKTPAWYNSDNVTEEESFIATGDSVKELKDWLKQRQEKEKSADSQQNEPLAAGR